LNNFQGVSEVVDAFTSVPISRLSKTLVTVNPNLIKQFNPLIALVSNEMNYKNLRDRLKNIMLPAIPPPSFWQHDLFFVGESNHDTFIGHNVINFQKINALSDCVFDIQVIS
jgi:hypothetical protein